MPSNLHAPAPSLVPTLPWGLCFFVHISALVALASVEHGCRLYVKHDSNKDLDEKKEKFFKPHGLFALVMAYQTEPDGIVQEEVDIEHTS
ncbi:hypothetical protein A1O7_00980 [Cladophialophora yegresii CBS 114405]|uniref:Uncharacterized protein n=1 Tax=Cladophialophora yegresii CBS 114405 TaxID=1182544 RepID=W9W946_9EURO|nr:uncharacterized protein A1O7_00980 [Cladophialophora yegresii CBS 114405]EXJ64642.1 hypothetical protein A1O7_00980 [Cladophialophora yegresii CBS 114405]